MSQYWSSFRGPFNGLLKWHDMDVLWEFLKTSPEGWYVFDMLEAPPTHTTPGAELLIFLSESRQFLCKRHRADYCGLIYVDNNDTPEFIKIFDPKNMGTACGCSDKIILPRWTLTRIRPDAIVTTTSEPARKAGWFWQGFGRVLGRSPTRNGAD